MLKILLLVLVFVGIFLFVTRFSTKGNKPTFTKPNKQRIGEPLTIDDSYNKVKVDKKKELNRILDKISKRGMKSTTKKEKEFLHEYSGKL